LHILGDALAHVRLAVAFAIAVAVAVATVSFGSGRFAPLAAYDSAALVYMAWLWYSIWRLDSGATSRRALRADPGRLAADGLLLSASVISLVAVGVVLVDAGHKHGASKDILIGLGVISVVIGWCVVHTLFTVRYARLYYGHPEGGIDFNEDDPPRYIDFAYLAFTVGMTFQVSDTDLQSKEIRATVLRHMWLSYLFGAIIIAVTINLVAGLTTK
jgi:uncharacterized membrane protein